MDQGRLLEAWHVLPMILVQLHLRKDQLLRDNISRPSQGHKKQSKNLFSKFKHDTRETACQDKRTSGIGKTQVGERLEPLAGRKELGRISSSGIQVLFILILNLFWAGHARNCRYVTVFIHSTNIY